MIEQDAQAKTPVILVVDDEPAIGTLLNVALRRQGFDVLVACSGQQALDVYRQRHEAIALILMDVRMPGLSGPETLYLLRQINAQVRCCFMTGYSGEYTEKELLEQGAAFIFAKPLILAELTRILWQLVGQHAASPEAAA
jgi:DNA-binding response OmpR family regulator